LAANQGIPSTHDKTKAFQIKRSQIELIIEILLACTEPTRKTHLIFLAKINHYQLVSYIETLKKYGMIKAIDKPFKGFVTTKKGNNLLRLFADPQGSDERSRSRPQHRFTK
jgi:predicted transcriptional regulator